MDRQIDIAADNGLGFFLFCWYWKDNKGPINPEVIQNLPQHTSMNMFMKAKNKKRMKFALLVANHQGCRNYGYRKIGVKLSNFGYSISTIHSTLKLMENP